MEIIFRRHHDSTCEKVWAGVGAPCMACVSQKVLGSHEWLMFCALHKSSSAYSGFCADAAA